MWWLEIIFKKSSKIVKLKREKITLKFYQELVAEYKGNQLSIDAKTPAESVY